MRDDLMQRATELAQGRVPYVQATVVRAQHPTSSHAGDVALVYGDGVLEGFVGGECAESSVRVHALEVLVTGQPLLLRIRPGVAETNREEGAVTVTNPCLSGGSLEIFLEPRRPAPRLVVTGDTPVARALATLGAPLGFLVESGAAEAVRADDAGVVVTSHGYEEQPVLEAAVAADVPYVALVASRTRGAAVLASLDVTPQQRQRVHSPAGLDIGARTAEEIALSILAEIIQERAAAATPTASTAAAAPAVLTAPAVSSAPAVSTAVDPVCGMTVVMATETPHVQDGDTVVWFCSTRCRETYAARPK